MPREFSRVERVNILMQRELAQLLLREIKDPRMPKFISVSEVVTSRDLSHAKVYITFLEDQTDPEAVVAILNKAAGFLRSTLARKVKLRSIPQLKFFYDASITYGNRMSALIDKVINSDEQDSDE